MARRRGNSSRARALARLEVLEVWLCPKCLLPISDFFDACCAGGKRHPITRERIEALLARSAEDGKKLREDLDRVFRLPPRNLMLD